LRGQYLRAQFREQRGRVFLAHKMTPGIIDVLIARLRVNANNLSIMVMKRAES
jgi:hypothetical protein